MTAAAYAHEPGWPRVSTQPGRLPHVRCCVLLAMHNSSRTSVVPCHPGHPQVQESIWWREGVLKPLPLWFMGLLLRLAHSTLACCGLSCCE
jgi:hypothetical protein